MADDDTGYGSPMNVKRTVESYASAGAAGVMIEDQTWPKRSGHTKAMTRAPKFARLGVDAVFVEALPDAASMRRAVKEVGISTLPIIIEGGMTQNLSAKDFAKLGMCAVAYSSRLVAAKLKAAREALESLKESMTLDAPPEILSYDEVCYGVGFNKYWEREEKYKFNEDGIITPVQDGAVNGHENGMNDR